MNAARKTVRLDFCDFYPGFIKTNNFFYHLLREKFDVLIADKPEFLIYSHEGHAHKLHSGTKIYFTVESFRPDFRECDYAFTCFDLPDPRHLRLPIYVMGGPPESLLKDHLNLEKVLAAKTRFCSFIVSNPNQKKTRQRIEFFQRLSRYKKVDSGGRLLNNLGYNIGGFGMGKVEFLKSCKFNIAFENKSLAGYTTEKIFEPMQAMCLPIYWGNPLIHTEFNPKSFLNYFDFAS
jgi:alpha(1,3/1,4) fucosyltransferase